MIQPPLVTVVVPCYRQATFLPTAVKSVVAQRFPHWELIIVDDGSPDETPAVATQLIATYPGYAIKLLRQANAGLGLARNAGIAAGSGPYILPLDADDAILPTMLERMVATFDTHPETGFVYSDVVWFGAEKRLYRSGAFDAQRLTINNYLTSHALLRRVAWQAAGGYVGRAVMNGFEDWDLWLSLIELGWQGTYLPEPLLAYRRREGSMLASAYRNDLQLRAKLILRHQRLYARPFVAWATHYLSAPQTPYTWLSAFAGYATLVARYAPHALPKTLGRPLFALLSTRQQGQIRQLARNLLSLGVQRH